MVGNPVSAINIALAGGLYGELIRESASSAVVSFAESHSVFVVFKNVIFTSYN